MENDSQDPGILCFQHCDKNAQVFCFTLPRFCELCGADLYISELRIPPFRIPYPFVAAAAIPCSIVIRPTVGDFLHNYQNAADLHIGVTNSKGVVFEYDKNGLTNDDTAKWCQSLRIDILSQMDAKLLRQWDKTLEKISQQDRWSSTFYSVDDHNCYSFVLEFLKLLQLHFTKLDFCQQFILPKTVSAGKYISLYRNLIKNKTFIKLI
ncbi:hypothetical protein CHUAL_013186 [Chamberlinius hualienensis]